MAEAAKTGSEAFGQMLREARERLGMSRRDLAEATGLSYPYISQLETGYRTPSSPALRSLSDALGLRVDTLFAAIPPSASRETVPSPAAGREPTAPGSEPVHVRAMSAPRAPAPPRASAPAAPVAPTPAAVPPAIRAGAAPRPIRAPAPAGSGVAGGTAAGGSAASGGGVGGHGATDSAPPPAAAVPAAAGGWFDNARYSAAAGGAATGAGAFRTDPEPTPDVDRVVDQAAKLLESLPSGERLDALTQVQARVVQSVVQDEVRGAAAAENRRHTQA